MTSAQPRSLGGVRAAAALQKLGIRTAGEMVKLLSPTEAEALVAGFAEIERMSPGKREELTAEALDALVAGSRRATGPLQFAEQLLGRSLGSEQALRVLQQSPGAAAASKLASLQDSEVEALAHVLKVESPRIAAVVLSSLRPGVAARVLSQLPNETGQEGLLHLAEGNAPAPEAAAAILEKVSQMVTDVEKSPDLAISTDAPGGGSRKVVEILRQCDRETERSAPEYMEEHSPEIAREVSQGIFSSMEDLKWLDDRARQIALREVDLKDLARALRGASEELLGVCCSSLSENVASDLKEEIEALGPTPRREVDGAQEKILGTIRTMIEEDRIQVATEEELV